MSVQASFHFLKKYAFLIAAIVLFFAFTPSTHAAVTDRPGSNTGLAGYWSLNDGVGTIAHDFSGNLNSGTLTNGPTWVNGKLGKAVNFDGSNDYIEVPYTAVNNPSTFTISVWAKVTGGQGTFRSVVTSRSISPDLGYMIYANNSNQWAFWMGDNSSGWNILSGSSLVLNQWTHIVAKYDGNIMSLYINGALVTSSTIGSIPVNTSKPLRIGGGATESTMQFPFFGSIDEVRVYNRVLSTTEITSLFRTSSTRYTLPTRNGAVALWSFDDNSGTRARDFSWNGNDGTLAGSTGGLPTWVAGKRSRAIRFDGVDDQVNVSQTSSINVSNNATISLWIKPETSNDGDAFQSGLGVAGAMTVWMAGSQGNQIWFGRQQGNVPDWAVSSTTFVPGQWIHVTGVMNAGVETIYINGVAEGSSSNNGSFTNGATYLIGSGDDGHFQGTIDDVKIYNRALSASEVMANYRAGNVVVNGNQNARMTNGLVGLWSFNGADISGTTAYDRSGNSNNGTLTNGPTPTIGKLGQALSFDGVNDYVSIASGGGLNNTQTGTISLWVKWSGTQNAACCGGVYGNVMARQSNGVFSNQIIGLSTNDPTTAKITWQPYNGGVPVITGSTAVGNNKWRHIAIVYSSGSHTLYVDGISDGTSATTGTISNDSSIPLTVGAWIGSGNVYAKANVDEVRTYNRALSASEIKQLYLMGK